MWPAPFVWIASLGSPSRLLCTTQGCLAGAYLGVAWFLYFLVFLLVFFCLVLLPFMTLYAWLYFPLLVLTWQCAYVVTRVLARLSLSEQVGHAMLTAKTQEEDMRTVLMRFHTPNDATRYANYDEENLRSCYEEEMRMYISTGAPLSAWQNLFSWSIIAGVVWPYAVLTVCHFYLILEIGSFADLWTKVVAPCFH